MFTDTSIDFVADTYVVLAFEWDGVDTARFFVDGVLRHTENTVANLPIGTTMSPVMQVDNDTAAANTMTVDYILFINERAST